jgi:hypothetical protein
VRNGQGRRTDRNAGKALERVRNCEKWIRADGEWKGNNGKKVRSSEKWTGTENRQEIKESMGNWLWS